MAHPTDPRFKPVPALKRAINFSTDLDGVEHRISVRSTNAGRDILAQVRGTDALGVAGWRTSPVDPYRVVRDLAGDFITEILDRAEVPHPRDSVVLVVGDRVRRNVWRCLGQDWYFVSEHRADVGESWEDTESDDNAYLQVACSALAPPVSGSQYVYWLDGTAPVPPQP